MELCEKVYALVARIPRGRVASYGQVAAWCGSPRAARAVGRALARVPRGLGLPCHRVVRSDGSVTEAFGPGGQRRLLEREGIVFTPDGRVDMGRFHWEGEGLAPPPGWGTKKQREAMTVMRTVLHDVAELGQSIWLDTISRDLILSGGLKEWIGQGVAGVTTNPSIFEQAIANTGDYDREIAAMAREGRDASAIYEALTLQEVGAAADILRPVHDRTGGLDGYVSLEVNPLLAADRDSTVSEARRLFAALGRPNVMIKIPATPEGVGAVEDCIAAGVNVNATLIFSAAQYASVAEAYVRGLEARALQGLPPTVASVASVFVSRVDTAVDKMLVEKGESALQGRIAVDGIRAAYRRFRSIFSGPRWDALAAKGAGVQRPLWASTGTKNPAYSDVLYLEALIGPDTVNTVPPKTLTAFLDHGRAALTLDGDPQEERKRLARLGELGIDLDAICATLLKDGLSAFEAAFRSLLAAIGEKAGA